MYAEKPVPDILPCTSEIDGSPTSTMTKLSFASAALILALALASKHSDAQQPDLVNSARQRNVVDVQFFADPNFQQTNTPFAYYDFPPIQDGSCSACEDFPVRVQLFVPPRRQSSKALRL